MRKVFVLGTAVVLAASTAFAAPNVVNNSQKGSLLIFTDIDIRDGHDTVVRLVNDGDADVKVKCIYSDAGGPSTLTNEKVPVEVKYKDWSDFVITLTSRQPIWCDARTGWGSNGPGTCNSFAPESPWGVGELICFAVTNTVRSKRKFNHLSGTATVFDSVNGGAYEYSAHAFYLRDTSVGDPDVLALDGSQYDTCPSYLVGQFSPVGATVSGANQPGFFVTQNRLTVAGCTQAPRQDGTPVFTKLEFEVWNANEAKFTGAYRCVDSWWETLLGGDQQMYNENNFSLGQLGTASAYYRVRAVQSSRCLNSVSTGLIGTASSRITVVGVGLDDTVGTQLTQAGRFAGTITFDLGSRTEEGIIR